MTNEIIKLPAGYSGWAELLADIRKLPNRDGADIANFSRMRMDSPQGGSVIVEQVKISVQSVERMGYTETLYAIQGMIDDVPTSQNLHGQGMRLLLDHISKLIKSVLPPTNTP